MSMFDQFPRQFGSYELLEKIAQGGMAAIYRGRTQGPHGFAKELVIKKILPALADDEEFIAQFLDEARIAGNLSHPNIVQIYDVGQVGADFFIAMEYVRGKHLGQVIRRAKETMYRFPAHIGARIINEVGTGLAFAHSARDPLGRHLNIIHRDISPQNILLAFHGSVKLTDFGIAKAANKLFHTTAGVLKGKFAYMAPEQTAGHEVTQSCDLFSLGVVFWEMLAGHRLFQGDSDGETLQRIRRCEIPSLRHYHEGVPEELETIIRRLLAPDPAHRYPSAHELVRDLSTFLATSGLSGEIAPIANFMGSLFPEEIQVTAQPATAVSIPAMSLPESEAIETLGPQDNYNPVAPSDYHPAPSGPRVPVGNAAVVEAPTQLLEASSDLQGEEGETRSEAETAGAPTAPLGKTIEPRKRNTLLWFFLALLGLSVLAVGGAVAYKYTSKGRPMMRPLVRPNVQAASIEIQVTPPQARVTLNGSPLSGTGKPGQRRATDLLGGLEYHIRVTMPGYLPYHQLIEVKDGQKRALVIQLQPDPAARPQEPSRRPKGKGQSKRQR